MMAQAILLDDLERLKHSMGELFFSAQYQQEPIPLAGNIVKAEWFKYYDFAPSICDSDDLVVISIDTAMKGSPSADFSVATVWLARGEKSYLIDLWRERVDYPELRRAVCQLRERYPTAALLIEDKGSGTSLLQDLRSENKTPIPINPEGDKITRLSAASVQFESGAVWFPEAAPWLSSLKAELLGFPSVKHDDQVDSVSQALAWIKHRRQYHDVALATPIVVFSRPRESFDIPRISRAELPFEPAASPHFQGSLCESASRKKVRKLLDISLDFNAERSVCSGPEGRHRTAASPLPLPCLMAGLVSVAAVILSLTRGRARWPPASRSRNLRSAPQSRLAV
jgi:predicted phage terminase large subunit-like protein